MIERSRDAAAFLTLRSGLTRPDLARLQALLSGC